MDKEQKPMSPRSIIKEEGKRKLLATSDCYENNAAYLKIPLPSLFLPTSNSSTLSLPLITITLYSNFLTSFQMSKSRLASRLPPKAHAELDGNDFVMSVKHILHSERMARPLASSALSFSANMDRVGRDATAATSSWMLVGGDSTQSAQATNQHARAGSNSGALVASDNTKREWSGATMAKSKHQVPPIISAQQTPIIDRTSDNNIIMTSYTLLHPTPLLEMAQSMPQPSTVAPSTWEIVVPVRCRGKMLTRRHHPLDGHPAT
jgi:hypothetical protein